jgi:hypothetical protein
MLWKDWVVQHAPQALALGGLLVGLLYGSIAFRTNFCTMGAISDFMTFGDYRRFRAWLLAAGVAIAGAQALDYTGVVPLAKSMYLAPNVNWLGHILGGLVFGFGMMFAGGCPSRNLTRVGSGDLRALLTLVVLGIFAYMAIGGVLGPSRAWLEQATVLPLAGSDRTQSIGDVFAAFTGLPTTTARLAIAMAVVAGILVLCFKDMRFRTSPAHILSGLGIGLCVVAGWAVTGMAFDELTDKPVQPVSLTYVRPAGDTLDWLQRFTALGLPGFGVASVFGAVAGAFLAALAMRRIHLVTFSGVADTLRSLFGAALMGVGGVMALGCTIGQGITGVSTLAIGSFLTFGAIVAGGMAGLKALERTLEAAA